MTTPTLDPWLKTQWAPRVMQIFQTKGNRLRAMVTPGEVNASKVIFRFIGKATVQEKIRNQPLVEQGAPTYNQEIDTREFAVFDTIEDKELRDIGDIGRENLAQAGAVALGKRVDQIIIDALNARAPASGEGYVGDATPGAMTLAHAMLIVEALANQEVPDDGEAYAIVPTRAWSQLMTYEQFTSADYVQDAPFTKQADTRKWMGVNWVRVENSLLPSTGANLRDGFAWHKSAVGWGNGTDLRGPEWDRNLKRIGWDYLLHFDGNAKALQPNGLPPGIVRFRVNTNTPIGI